MNKNVIPYILILSQEQKLSNKIFNKNSNRLTDNFLSLKRRALLIFINYTEHNYRVLSKEKRRRELKNGDKLNVPDTDESQTWLLLELQWEPINSGIQDNVGDVIDSWKLDEREIVPEALLGR